MKRGKFIWSLEVCIIEIGTTHTSPCYFKITRKQLAWENKRGEPFLTS